MSATFRYLTGVGLVAVAGTGALLAAPATDRTGVGAGLLAGLVLQAPLGWWALRALGTERFMLVWGLGMLLRFALVAVAGLALSPLLGRDAGPMLLAMVGILMALLAVEGATAVREHSREGER